MATRTVIVDEPDLPESESEVEPEVGLTATEREADVQAALARAEPRPVRAGGWVVGNKGWELG